MKRFLPGYQSLRALLGLAVIVLQVVAALHFTLVRHGYSAALGGVVHVHASARAEQRRQANVAAPLTSTAVSSDAPSCAAELCPDANAPRGSAPHFELLAAGVVAFGETYLLSERGSSSSESPRVFLSAPKTSPPV
jgi:hypothetical protein